ncbi:uncharacterized protein TNCV_2266191 [Trichonephila clavipes]|nr:uncharacterized protein TNCV_2266191 [Trichonephila clavipes]
MHWRHRFPMLFIKLSDTGIGSEDQTQSKPCFSSCNDLEEDLKQQPLCQDSPKDVTLISDLGLEMELAIPFVPNRDPPDTPQQSGASVRSCIIIHQNEVVTNSSSIWADIWIKGLGRYLRPVTVPPWNTCRSVWPPSEIPAQTRIPPPL